MVNQWKCTSITCNAQDGPIRSVVVKYFSGEYQVQPSARVAEQYGLLGPSSMSTSVRVPRILMHDPTAYYQALGSPSKSMCMSAS